jgi:hypothetical protein
MIRFGMTTLVAALLLLFSTQSFAATPDKQRISDALELLRQSVNAHDYSMLEPGLDEAFTYQGQNGRMSEMIMRQVVEGFPNEITGITVLSFSPSGDGWNVAVRLETAKEPDQRQVSLSSDYRILQADIADIAMAGHGQAPTASINSLNNEMPAITTIPFELVEQLIMVKAEVNGVFGNFMIDTGGQASMLNSTRFAAGTIEVFEMNHAPPSGAGGEILDARGTNNLEISLGGLKVSGARAMVMDMSHMEESIGVELAGVIGFEVLQQFQLYFDYAAQEITLQVLNEQHQPLESLPVGKPEQVVDFEFDRHIPVFPVRIGELDLKVGLDSGASGQMIFTRFQDQLRDEYEFIKRDEMRGADRNVQMGDVVRIPSMELAGISYPDMTFRFNDLAEHGGRPIPYDGLLGYGFLSSRPTAINFQTRQLMVWPETEM